jgi:CheY-like chemotaxis protein
MTGIHDRIVAKGKQDASNRVDERRVIASGQIGSTNRSSEERVADEQVHTLPRPSRLPRLLTHRQAHAARAMAGGVVRSYDEVAEMEHVVRRVKVIDRRGLLDAKAEEASVSDGLVVQEQIVAMERHRHIEGTLRRGDTGHVVHVGVSQQNLRERDALAPGELEQAVDFVAGIDEHAFARPRTRDHESIFEERSDGLRLDYDHNVILAILDDLLFTSKMRATAKQIGATLTVAKSREAALAEMRAHPPAMVIFDLNNPRTDPLGIIADMKGDPALSGIPTVGFVSHVDTATIDAARHAGVNDVMARSMFAERLPQILAKGM